MAGWFDDLDCFGDLAGFLDLVDFLGAALVVLVRVGFERVEALALVDDLVFGLVLVFLVGLILTSMKVLLGECKCFLYTGGMKWIILILVTGVLLALVTWTARGRLGLGEGIKPGEIVEIDRKLNNLIANERKDVLWKLEEVASGLEVPWDIEFTSEDRLLVTERGGRIQLIEGQLKNEPWLVINDVGDQGEAGLMGMALDPDYENNKHVYVCYAYEDGGGLKDRVVRIVDQGENGIVDRLVIEDIPAAIFHAGCRLAFGPDDKLYITTGDARNGELAQEASSLAGKILRINPDGSVPVDNPIANSPVWTWGHRNPQGIAWHPVTGEMYESEHGPSGNDGPGGGDEINRIVKGSNYGWPVVHHEESREGMKDPLVTFTPAEAPGSALIYKSDRLPQWTNKLLFGALRGEGIIVVSIDENNPDQVTGYEKLDISVGRIREVQESPDGLIYFSTSNQDGRGTLRSGDDRIFKIVPQE